jgi:hypothetical protein
LINVDSNLILAIRLLFLLPLIALRPSSKGCPTLLRHTTGLILSVRVYAAAANFVSGCIVVKIGFAPAVVVAHPQIFFFFASAGFITVMQRR